MKPNRPSDEFIEDVKLILNPPSSTGRWGDLSGMDPKWVYAKCHERVEQVEYIEATDEDAVAAAKAIEHLPTALRPLLEDPDTHFVWSDGDGLAVLTKVDGYVIEVISIDSTQAANLTGIVRLDSRTREGTISLYRSSGPK